MLDKVDCSWRECWQVLLDGTQPPEQRELCERHVESCPVCQDQLDRSNGSGERWQQLVQRIGDPTLVPTDPTLVQVVHRLLEEPVRGRTQPAASADLSFLQPSDQEGVLGTLGSYEVREVLGQGGMGIVLKAFDPRLNRLVAIKVLSPAVAGSATCRRRFTREAQSAAAVCHDNIVAVHAVSEAEGLPYLVMQYIAGESLQARLERTGPLEVAEIVRIGRETAAGLAAAHAQGLIHRDIKPDNLLLEDEPGASGKGGRVKITDFGLARLVDDVGLTQNGVVAGTPEYIAPEQARGEPLDHRADLFSLGSVLYAFCTGVPPFRGSTALGVLLQVSNEEPTPIREQNPKIPVWLEAFIMRLMAKDPARRPQSAAEATGLLEAYLASLLAPLTVPAPELPLPPVGRSSGLAAKLGRRVAPLFGLAVLLILALLASWFFKGFGAGQIEDNTKPNTALQEVFAYDFRGKPIPDSLAFFGDQDGQFLKPEPEGLRITLPKTYLHPWGGVGVSTTFEIEGDFEITATVEVLHADRPAQGNGVGTTLGISKVDPAVEGAAVLRVRKIDDTEVVAWDQIIDAPNEKWGRYLLGNPKPCSDKVGRMRLKRTGSTLFYQWGPGLEGETFDTIHQLENFGVGPIRTARVAAFTGRQPCVIDVRLIALRVLSGPAAPGGSQAGSSLVGRKGGLALAALGALTIAMLLFLLQRRRSDRQTALASGEEQAKDQPAAAICFPCAACRKNLKVRVALAGKKVKCPCCGQPVLVPEAQADQADGVFL